LNDVKLVEENISSKLGLQLLKKIISTTSPIIKNNNLARYKPNATHFLNDLQFNKIEMICALNFLKTRYPDYHELISVPKEWEMVLNESNFELFSSFLENQCEIGEYQSVSENPNNYYWCHKKDMLKAYNRYLGGLEIPSVTMTTLTKYVNALDCITIKTRRINGKPVRIFVGLRLNQ